MSQTVCTGNTVSDYALFRPSLLHNDRAYSGLAVKLNICEGKRCRIVKGAAAPKISIGNEDDGDDDDDNENDDNENNEEEEEEQEEEEDNDDDNGDYNNNSIFYLLTGALLSYLTTTIGFSFALPLTPSEPPSSQYKKRGGDTAN